MSPKRACLSLEMHGRMTSWSTWSDKRKRRHHRDTTQRVAREVGCVLPEFLPLPFVRDSSITLTYVTSRVSSGCVASCTIRDSFAFTSSLRSVVKRRIGASDAVNVESAA